MKAEAEHLLVLKHDGLVVPTAYLTHYLHQGSIVEIEEAFLALCERIGVYLCCLDFAFADESRLSRLQQAAADIHLAFDKHHLCVLGRECPYVEHRAEYLCSQILRLNYKRVLRIVCHLKICLTLQFHLPPVAREGLGEYQPTVAIEPHATSVRQRDVAILASWSSDGLHAWRRCLHGGSCIFVAFYDLFIAVAVIHHNFRRSIVCHYYCTFGCGIFRHVVCL